MYEGNRCALNRMSSAGRYIQISFVSHIKMFGPLTNPVASLLLQRICVTGKTLLLHVAFAKIKNKGFVILKNEMSSVN